jgi:nicotinamidase-related amidase
MKLSITSVCAAALVSSQAAFAQKSVPGYESYSSNETVPNFGQHYAVLNLDLINGLIKPIANTSQGECFINSMSQWINAVHAQKPAPLSIFTRIYFTNSKKPELGYGVPFAQVGAALGNSSDPNTFLYPAFTPIPDYDVILQKNRYYAGSGNELELILASERIDTVILSGIRTSGVILSTAYRLFDVNYKV